MFFHIIFNVSIAFQFTKKTLSYTYYIFKYTFHPGLPGHCICKSVEKSQNVAKATFVQSWALF